MKKTKSLSKGRTGIFGLKSAGICGIIMLVMALAACNFSPPDTKPTVSNNSTSLTRTEQLALLKTQDNNKISMDKLETIVTKTLATPGGRSVASAGSTITGVKKLSLDEKHFTLSGSARSALGIAEEEPVEVYEFAVGSADNENEGFVLASNDVRIGTILAIAEGSLEDANENFVGVLSANLNDYIAATILEYSRITEAEIEAAIAKIEGTEEARAVVTEYDPSNVFNSPGWSVMIINTDFAIQKGPMLKTKWGQGTPGTYTSNADGNYVYNNYVMYDHGNMNHITGCGPTAVAQIVAYHNYISPTAPYKPSAFPSSLSSSLGTWKGGWATTKPFDTIRNLPTITNTSSDAARGQVAALMYQIGKLMPNINYQNKLTTHYTSDASAAFLAMGYNNTVSQSATGVTTSYNASSSTHTFTITHYITPATIKNALNVNRPIYIDGIPSTGGIGHAWVIDGHGQMTSYIEILTHPDYPPSNGGRTSRQITLTDCLMVYCNLGWNGQANGWYVYGIFDTNRRYLLGDDDTRRSQNYSTNTLIIIPTKP